MYEQLQQALENQDGPLAGRSIRVAHSLRGGNSHTAWQLKLHEGSLVFLKCASSTDLPMLVAEAEGLRSLKTFLDPNLVTVPEPWYVGFCGGQSVLVLPWFDMVSGDQSSLGRGLARLHLHSANQSSGKGFGWDQDGFIGRGPQPGGWRYCWADAFIDLRLRPQLDLARCWRQDNKPLSNLLEKLRVILSSHRPSPSLVHGDLWGGNAAVLSDGRGVLFDPACWWADREVDLAMTMLFGGFSSEFFTSYNQQWRLSEGWENRVQLYNLYHLLNHANLFGGGYRRQCVTQLRKLLASV